MAGVGAVGGGDGYTFSTNLYGAAHSGSGRDVSDNISDKLSSPKHPFVLEVRCSRPAHVAARSPPPSPSHPSARCSDAAIADGLTAVPAGPEDPWGPGGGIRHLGAPARGVDGRLHGEVERRLGRLRGAAPPPPPPSLHARPCRGGGQCGGECGWGRGRAAGSGERTSGAGDL